MIRNTARHAHAPIQTELAHLRLELGAVGAFAKDQQLRGDRRRKPLQRVDEVSHPFARNQVADIENQERVACDWTLAGRGQRFREPQTVRNDADRNVHQLADFAGRVRRDGHHLVRGPQRPLEKLLQPGQAALDPAELDAVPQRNEPRHSSAAAPRGPAEQRVGYGPMHVHDVDVPATREPPGGAHSGQHVKRRHQLVANGVTDAVYGPLIVGQVFPARGEITEAVDRNAFQLLIAATAVGGGEDFDLQSRGALPSQQLDEPRSNDIPGGARECRNYMENAH